MFGAGGSGYRYRYLIGEEYFYWYGEGKMLISSHPLSYPPTYSLSSPSPSPSPSHPIPSPPSYQSDDAPAEGETLTPSK